MIEIFRCITTFHDIYQHFPNTYNSSVFLVCLHVAKLHQLNVSFEIQPFSKFWKNLIPWRPLNPFYVSHPVHEHSCPLRTSVSWNCLVFTPVLPRIPTASTVCQVPSAQPLPLGHLCCPFLYTFQPFTVDPGLGWIIGPSFESDPRAACTATARPLWEQPSKGGSFLFERLNPATLVWKMLGFHSFGVNLTL